MPYHKQPLKALYLVGQTFAIPFFYAPYWLLSSIPSFFNPVPKGGSRISVAVRRIRINYLRQVMLVVRKAGLSSPFPDHTRIAPPKLPSSHGVWIPPLPDGLVIGEIKLRAETLGVSSIQIPGYWILKDDRDLKVDDSPRPGEKILYYTHGGGYITLTAHPDGPMAPVPKGFLDHCSSITRAFSVEYRLLSPGPTTVHPFPTALLDALAGYTYLVNLGFKEEDIVLCGDSAGGNLALALIRYLVDHREKVADLPRIPGALVLISPWADMNESFDAEPAESTVQAAAHDWTSPMNSEEVMHAIEAFLGHRPDEVANLKHSVYWSPASRVLLTESAMARKISFKDFPRTWVDFGGSEVLRSQIIRLAHAMEEDLGKDNFILNECPGGIHGYITFEWFEPERSENMKKIAAWLEA